MQLKNKSRVHVLLGFFLIKRKDPCYFSAKFPLNVTNLDDLASVPTHLTERDF